MDRQIVWPGQIPLETDLLNTNRNTLIGLGMLSQDILGTSTIASGFACTQSTPQAMTVTVGPGRLYAQQNLDNTNYSSLAADTMHQIVKQGISLNPVTLNTPAPATQGNAINYLIQATYQDVDANAVALPYYNSSNPSQPYLGPGGNGATQATVRQGQVVLVAKPGIAAPAGVQTTPAPDNGYVPLWVVTVAFGQTSVTNANISKPANSALLAGSILQMLQGGAASFALDTGAANAYVCAFSPALTARTEGVMLRFKAANANTGACTLNDGLGAVQLVGAAHAPLQGGEIVAGSDCVVMWNSSVSGGAYVLLEATGGGVQVTAASQPMQAVNLGQFPTSKSANGWVQLPNGIILQWGSSVISGTGSAGKVVTLPITFPNSCLAAFASDVGTGANAYGAQLTSNSTITVWQLAYVAISTTTIAPATNGAFHWFAIGY